MTFKTGDVTRCRDGSQARILCTDALPPRSLIALVGKHQDTVWRYYPNGVLNEYGKHPYDLERPYQNPSPADFKQDQPLLVRDTPDEPWRRAHYCRSSRPSDTVSVWHSGKTSFTTTMTCAFKQWKLPEPC